MSSLQDLEVFVHNNTEAKAERSYAHAISSNSTRHARISFGFLTQGYCERNKKNIFWVSHSFQFFLNFDRS